LTRSSVCYVTLLIGQRQSLTCGLFKNHCSKRQHPSALRIAWLSLRENPEGEEESGARRVSLRTSLKHKRRKFPNQQGFYFSGFVWKFIQSAEGPA
jgi:hypothetical protein